MQSNDTGAGDKILDFLQKNRKGLYIVLGIIVGLFVVFITFISINNHFKNNDIVKIEEFIKKIDEYETNDDGISKYVYDDVLLSDLLAFAKNKTGYAGGRAWTIIGSIYSQRGEWEKSCEAWQKGAKAAKKTYLEPICYFNGAAAAEENGNIELAISLLEKCISSKEEFPAFVRAQFSIGRLNEQLKNTDKAISAYRSLIIKWPEITTWVDLAHSRITALESLDSIK